jgi:uncharacterized protein (DUF305 family)
VLLASGAMASGQESSLPDVCLATDAGHDMGGMQTDMPMAPMDDAHTEMMAGMGRMQSDMDMGMKAEDIDVAFICAMIPHHQGAIDMAKAELKYGDDPWAKEMAQKVIDAQTAEIAQMKEWLEKNAR